MKHFEPNKNATELGIDTTRKFRVVNIHEGETNYQNGDIVKLKEDDDTNGPFFKNNKGEKIWILWEELYYAEEELKQGDMVYVSDTDEEDALETEKQRILIKKCNNGYIVVHALDEELYKRGDVFCTEDHKYAVKVPTETEEQKEEELEFKIGDKYCLIHTDNTLSYGIIDFIHNENGEINYAGIIRPGFERLRKPTQEELDKYFA